MLYEEIQMDPSKIGMTPGDGYSLQGMSHLHIRLTNNVTTITHTGTFLHRDSIIVVGLSIHDELNLEV